LEKPLTSTTGILFHSLFLAIAMPSAIADLRSLRIPDLVVYPGIVTFLALISIAMPDRLADSLIAAFLAIAFLWLIRIFTKGLGFGDVKFGSCMGLYCGTHAIFPAFMIAALTGILVAAILIKTGKMNRKAHIPFAPFLAFGAISARVMIELICWWF
jgi:leader peptidase (prepilin peptidase)/N-methyltransferase